MGRLVLHILLSFAQFEREIIGERIRDKIAAQRRKGKWAGGIPVLGYDVDRTGQSPKLVVNVTEAARVRQIFALYQKLGSLLAVAEELNRREWPNKAWMTKKGNRRGGRPFDKGSLHALLTNPIYMGLIKHKEDLYEGEHEPLITPEVFREVQARLQKNGRTGGGETRNKHNALLQGRLFCKACQRVMVHTFTTTSTRRYRYYTCSNAIHSGRKACPSPSLRALEIEAVVLEQVRKLAGDEAMRSEVLRQVHLHAKEEKQCWHEERRGLEKELARHHVELRQASTSEVQNDATTALIDYLHERIAKAETRIAELDKKLASADRDVLSSEHVVTAMNDFDKVWAALSPREQRHVVGLLASQVVFDPDDNSITMDFHSMGTEESEERGAVA